MCLIAKCEILRATGYWVGDLTIDRSGRDLACPRRKQSICAGSSYGQGRKGTARNLLSYHICVVACFDFEAAVVGPEIDGDTDTGDAALVYLYFISSLFI